MAGTSKTNITATKLQHKKPKQQMSLANSVDYWRDFCLFRDSWDGGTL